MSDEAVEMSFTSTVDDDYLGGNGESGQTSFLPGKIDNPRFRVTPRNPSLPEEQNRELLEVQLLTRRELQDALQDHAKLLMHSKFRGWSSLCNVLWWRANWQRYGAGIIAFAFVVLAFVANIQARNQLTETQVALEALKEQQGAITTQLGLVESLKEDLENAITVHASLSATVVEASALSTSLTSLRVNMTGMNASIIGGIHAARDASLSRLNDHYDESISALLVSRHESIRMLSAFNNESLAGLSFLNSTSSAEFADLAHRRVRSLTLLSDQLVANLTALSHQATSTLSFLHANYSTGLQVQADARISSMRQLSEDLTVDLRSLFANASNGLIELNASVTEGLRQQALGSMEASSREWQERQLNFSNLYANAYSSFISLNATVVSGLTAASGEVVQGIVTLSSKSRSFFYPCHHNQQPHSGTFSSPLNVAYFIGGRGPFNASHSFYYPCQTSFTSTAGSGQIVANNTGGGAGRVTRVFDDDPSKTHFLLPGGSVWQVSFKTRCIQAPCGGFIAYDATFHRGIDNLWAACHFFSNWTRPLYEGAWYPSQFYDNMANPAGTSMNAWLNITQPEYVETGCSGTIFVPASQQAAVWITLTSGTILPVTPGRGVFLSSVTFIEV